MCVLNRTHLCGHFCQSTRVQFAAVCRALVVLPGTIERVACTTIGLDDYMQDCMMGVSPVYGGHPKRANHVIVWDFILKEEGHPTRFR